MATIESTTVPGSGEKKLAARLLERLDRFCARSGDLINPILVKETRQSLKSRQFVVTFSLILFAALAWTIAGSLSLMPGIYTTPSAPRMMIGYYLVLALPMLLVVPLAAYRSLESEIDDGTLELLSITTLSPWQIVLGKLGSASLQMLLYFVTLFPCLAYAYTLRGVDLPTTLLILGSLAAVGLLLTVIGLFFAPLARARTGRIVTLLALLFLLVVAEYSLGGLVINMIWYGNPLSSEALLFVVLSSLAVSVSFAHLLLTATAAQLTPETENRSTSLRLSLLVFTAVCIATAALAMVVLQEEGISVYITVTIGVSLLWTLAGALIVGERETITPRIRRELPSSFLARLFLTWLTPGPSTGLVFVIVTLWVLTLLQQTTLDWVARSGNVVGAYAAELRRLFGEPLLLYSGYLISFLVVVRLLMHLIRARNDPRVEVGMAALIVVAVMAALVPYSMQLHFNDYQPLDYDPNWQVTNWAFTISTSITRRIPNDQAAKVIGAALGLSLMAIFAAWQTTRPRRIATPRRVQQEVAEAGSDASP